MKRELSVALGGAAVVLGISLWIGARTGGSLPEQGRSTPVLSGSMPLDPFSSVPESPGEAPRREALKSPAPDSVAGSRIPDGYVIKGRVLDPIEQPIAGTHVVALRERASGMYGDHPELSDEVPQLGECESDAHGEFRMEVPPDLVLQLWADAAERGSAFGGTARAGDVVVIHVLPGGSIEGRCLVANEGVALVGASVRAVLDAGGVSSERWPAVESDQRGHWSLTGLPPGKYTLCATLVGGGLISAEVGVVSGKASACDLVLQTTVRVHGVVRDAATKAPIPAAEVTWWTAFSRPAETNSAGEYEFILPADCIQHWTNFTARATGHGSLRKGYVPESTRAPAEVQYDFDLPIEHSCTGVVRTFEGAPIPGASIAVRGSDVPSDQVSMNEELCKTRTDARGLFELQGLRADLPQTLYVSKPGFGTAVFRMPAGDPAIPVAALGEIRLAPAHELTGSVRTEEGKPISGCRLEIGGFDPDVGRWNSKEDSDPFSGEWKRSFHSDASGYFSIADLPAGTFTLTASRWGRQGQFVQEISIPSDRTAVSIDIVFPTGLAISGFVRDPQGQPLLTCTVSVQGETAGITHLYAGTYSGEDGSFSVTGLRPGSYELSVVDWCGRNKAESAPVFLDTTRSHVQAGSSDVEIRMEPGVRLTARVVGNDGQSTAHWSATVTDSDGKCVARGWADADRCIRAVVARNAPYSITVTPLVPSTEEGEGLIPDPDEAHATRVDGLVGGEGEIEIRLQSR